MRIYKYIHIWVVVKIAVPFSGTLNIGCRIIMGIQKGTTILTTTHIWDGAIFSPSIVSRAEGALELNKNKL